MLNHYQSPWFKEALNAEGEISINQLTSKETSDVCIVGGGLTGLITAIALSKLNLQVDLAIGSTKPNIKSNKTTAISQENYDFIKSLEIILLLPEKTMALFWFVSIFSRGVFCKILIFFLSFNNFINSFFILVFLTT